MKLKDQLWMIRFLSLNRTASIWAGASVITSKQFGVMLDRFGKILTQKFEKL